MNKKDARALARKKLTNLDETYRVKASGEIARRLTSENMWNKASDILFYFGTGSEVQTKKLIDQAADEGRNVFIPKVISDTDMVFLRISSSDDVMPGAYGISEPEYDPAGVYSGCPDMVVVPCVAVDRCGNRAGHGKGYYDRYLGKIRNASFICLAYDCQLFPYIETDENDIRMDIIITEKEIIRI